jgi:hypothetical protein
MERTGVSLLTESMGKFKGEQGAHTVAEERERIRAPCS